LLFKNWRETLSEISAGAKTGRNRGSRRETTENGGHGQNELGRPQLRHFEGTVKKRGITRFAFVWML
jgi:hypothetical protein